jgi:hypothetical protein
VDAGDTFTYTIVGGVDQAVFSISGNQLLIDDGVLDFETQNSYVVDIEVIDQGGTGLTFTETFTVTITDVNDVPTVANAIPDQVATEDVLFSFTFAANTFADVDAGDTLTYTSNASGWLSFDAATRTFTGTPLNADVGTTTVTVTATDGSGASVTDTFDIIVNNVNDAPVATDDAFTVNEGSTLNLDLAANDTDADGDLDITSITIVSGPTNGTITVNADGSVDYTHDGSETIADSFIYTIDDLSGNTSNTGIVSLAINPVNDAPVASNDSLTTNQGEPLTITPLTDLLVNDSDAEGNTLSITGFTQPANGTMVNNGNGTWTYTPDPTFFGVDTLTFTIDDGNGGTDTATLSLTVNILTDGSSTQTQSDNNNDNNTDIDIITVMATEPPSTLQDAAERYQQREESLSYTTARDVAALLSILNPVEILEFSTSLDTEYNDRDRRDREIASISNEMLWDELEDLRNRINDSAKNDDILGKKFSDILMSIGSLSVTSGLIAWLLRGGTLAASFVSAMPLWKGMDPLPVLTKHEEDDEAGDEDKNELSADKRVERLMKGESAHW